MWMQAAHEYYLQHATSEVGHRSPICSPCLQLLWAARSADRSPGRQSDRVETDHQDQDWLDFLFFGGDLYFRRDAHKVMMNNPRHSWRWSVGSLLLTTDIHINEQLRSEPPDWSRMFGCFRLVSPLRSCFFFTSHITACTPAPACCQINTVLHHGSNYKLQ